VTVGYSLPVRVYYEDTDAGGVVYYANYLHFMERARTEWLRALGFDVDDLAQRVGMVFAVRSVQVAYLKPARLSDLLTVGVRPERYGQASIQLCQEIHRDAELICDGQVRLACLDAASFAPRQIPKNIIAKLKTWKMS